MSVAVAPLCLLLLLLLLLLLCCVGTSARDAPAHDVDVFEVGV